MKTPFKLIFLATLIAFLISLGNSTLAFSADCPQKSKTRKAPSNIYKKNSPLKSTPENISAGEKLYKKSAKPLACLQCHGAKGDGVGKLAQGLNPQPRNFACKETMDKITDGQMFWIIKKGSKGTAMMGYKTLKDEQIWQLILYIKQFNG